jgi:HK97 gp10 family phage protein
VSDNVRVEGLDDLRKKLQDLSVNVEKYFSAVGEKAMAPVERAAKEKCNVDQGDTRGSITTQTETTDDGVEIRVGTPKRSAVYLEFGTGIYAENGQGRKSPWLWRVESAKWAGIFGVEVGDSVLWHGSHPHPFLRPAWNENQDQVKKIVRDELANAIKQVAGV